ncbi:MAG: hypothetical protein COB51_04325 [Moraxellaceae bacterium]|nr:MAG: hypothetical protein COB51_04325 [Moraxellaceae bacterium]
MKNILSLMLITLLASCAIYPNKPEFQMPDGARIGVILEIKDKAKEFQYDQNLYSDIKVTEHGVDWRLGELFLNGLNKKSNPDNKFEFVDLSGEGINVFLLGEIKPSNKTWNIPSRAKDEAVRIKEKYKLDALAILKEEDVSLGVICMPSGVCRHFKGVGYGLLKKSGMIFSTHHVVAGFGFDLILFDPLVNLSYTHEYHSLNKQKVIYLQEFKSPKKGEGYTSDHWSLVHQILNSHILELVDNVHLGMKGLPLPSPTSTVYEDDIDY